MAMNPDLSHCQVLVVWILDTAIFLSKCIEFRLTGKREVSYVKICKIVLRLTGKGAKTLKKNPSRIKEVYLYS